jgi:hypothetical protein
MKFTAVVTLFLMACLPVGVIAQPELLSEQIPILKRYDADHLLRIALPLGGIGTGTVSLGGRVS